MVATRADSWRPVLLNPLSLYFALSLAISDWLFQACIRASGCAASDMATASGRACPTSWRFVFRPSRRSPRPPSTPSRCLESSRRRTTSFYETATCASRNRVADSFCWRGQRHSIAIPCPRHLTDVWCSTSTENRVYAKPLSRYAVLSLYIFVGPEWQAEALCSQPVHSADYVIARCLSVCLSVCASLRPSVTRQYSVETANIIKLFSPGELSQWLCHYDSTINIVLDIIIIIIIHRSVFSSILSSVTKHLNMIL